MAPDLGSLLWIILSASFALANDHFVNPPDLKPQSTSLSSYAAFSVGDILDVSWVTAGGVVDLVINQLNSPDDKIDRTPNSAALTSTGYTWKITTDGSDGGPKFDLTFSNAFNFMAFKVNSTTMAAQSVYFNISNATVNQYGQRIATSTSTSTTRLPSSSIFSSLSLAQSTVSSSSTLSVSGVISPSPAVTTKTGTLLSETSASPTSASTNVVLSIGANVGLGIGIGIVSFIAISGVCLWFLFRKRRRNTQQILSSPCCDPPHTKTSSKIEDAHSNWSPPSELPVSANRKIYASESRWTILYKSRPTELPS